MDRIRIRGGRPLSGEIVIGGAKNAALKLMAASLLTAAPGLPPRPATWGSKSVSQGSRSALRQYATTSQPTPPDNR